MLTPQQVLEILNSPKRKVADGTKWYVDSKGEKHYVRSVPTSIAGGYRNKNGAKSTRKYIAGEAVYYKC